MEIMDKGLTVPKWMLIPPKPQNLYAQLVLQSPKVLDFNEKRLHWASIVQAYIQGRNKGLVPVPVLSTFSYYVLRQKCLES